MKNTPIKFYSCFDEEIEIPIKDITTTFIHDSFFKWFELDATVYELYDQTSYDVIKKYVDEETANTLEVNFAVVYEQMTMITQCIEKYDQRLLHIDILGNIDIKLEVFKLLHDAGWIPNKFEIFRSEASFVCDINRINFFFSVYYVIVFIIINIVKRIINKSNNINFTSI